MDEIKGVFRSVFTRDVRSVEPSKKGLIIGENLRIYDESGAYVVSFLEGTDRNARKAITDKLDQARVQYKVGKDFKS